MSEPTAEQVTFATLRCWAQQTIKLADDAQADRRSPLAGARVAARDVLAILDMNGRPPGEPVHFSNYEG